MRDSVEIFGASRRLDTQATALIKVNTLYDMGEQLAVFNVSSSSDYAPVENDIPDEVVPERSTVRSVHERIVGQVKERLQQQYAGHTLEVLPLKYNPGSMIDDYVTELRLEFPLGQHRTQLFQGSLRSSFSSQQKIVCDLQETR